VRHLVVLIAACGALVGCGNTYHPEYHPVTSTQYSQSLSYPVTVHNGGSAAERSPVVITPAPGSVVSQPGAPVMPAMPAPPGPPAPPSGWPN
jgi:hypothetical protein